MHVFRNEKCASYLFSRCFVVKSRVVRVVIAIIVVMVALRAMGRVSVESALIEGYSCLSSVVYQVMFVKYFFVKHCL